MSRSRLNVNAADDKSGTWITGCTVMPSGHIVLCDRYNNKIKLLDDSYAITGQLEMRSPYDVSVIDSSNVIVSLPNTMQLRHVQVFPRLRTGRLIHLDRQCWGVVVSWEEIYTIRQNNTGDGEVRVMDLKGNLKRRLGINPDRSYLFNGPYYITANVSGEKIFVSDLVTGTITCMTPSGRVIYIYKDDDMGNNYNGLICEGQRHQRKAARISAGFHQQ